MHKILANLKKQIKIHYHIAGKFGEFGESSLIRQTKTIQISTYNYKLFAESIHSLNFFTKCSKWVNSPNFPTIQYT